MIITETWLNQSLPIIHENYSSIQSPYDDYQGVVIIYKSNLNITNTCEAKWSPNFIAMTVRLTQEEKPALIIGSYLQPS